MGTDKYGWVRSLSAAKAADTTSIAMRIMLRRNYFTGDSAASFRWDEGEAEADVGGVKSGAEV